MLLPAPPLYPRKRRPRPKARRIAVVSELALVSASFDPSPPRIILGFNQPVDLNGLDAPTITVNDPADTGLKYYAFNGPNMIDPATFWLELVEDGAAVGEGTTMTANSFNGIAPEGGGAAWAGVADLELPFGG